MHLLLIIIFVPYFTVRNIFWIKNLFEDNVDQLHPSRHVVGF